MLRRDLRDIYQSFSQEQDKKDLVLAQLLNERPKETEMKGRKWKPKGQVGAWAVIVIICLLLLAAAGFGLHYFGIDAQVADLVSTLPTIEQKPEDATLPPTEDQQVETAPVQLSYQPIAAKYVEAVLDSWDMERCEQEDISYMVMFQNIPEDILCSFIDLDGNGVEEMIVSDGIYIFDLYTCANGEYVHVFSGGERDRYTLTEDGFIVNVGSGGAGYTLYRINMYYGTNLIPVELILCDSSKDPAEPWFRGINDPEQVEPISEEAAREIIERYPSMKLEGEKITAFD